MKEFEHIDFDVILKDNIPLSDLYANLIVGNIENCMKAAIRADRESRWITDKLPVSPSEVIFTEGKYSYQGQFINLAGRDLYYSFISNHYHKAEYITGWQPLPSPPKQEKL